MSQIYFINSQKRGHLSSIQDTLPSPQGVHNKGFHCIYMYGEMVTSRLLVIEYHFNTQSDRARRAEEGLA